MPEGDTLARIAHVLRPLLVGRVITAARGGPGAARLERVVGTVVTSVEARGKHLLITFDTGLTLHTHLGLHGSWHRYRRGERWRRPPRRAGAVLENDDWTTVCFDAPTVELIETRALAIHPVLGALGTDADQSDFDVDRAIAALHAPERSAIAIGDALLDQRAVAGLGNVYRSELCFIERLNPLTAVARVSDVELRSMLELGSALLRTNAAGGERVTTAPGCPSRLYVYGRTGRPCLRCRAVIRSTVTRRTPESPSRRVYWCPTCQPSGAG